MAYALAHKGKATADVAYNSEDPPSAYSNESVHSCLDGYTSMARVGHGLEYDPSAHDLDGEVVMRAAEARSMAGSGLATTQSTRPLLSLSPRFEHGARVLARRYAHGQTLHGSR